MWKQRIPPSVRGQFAFLLLCSRHEKNDEEKPFQMPKSGGRTISITSPKSSFRLKNQTQKAKEIKPGSSCFDTLIFIALEVEAAESCLINPGIWRVYQTRRGTKTS